MPSARKGPKRLRASVPKAGGKVAKKRPAPRRRVLPKKPATRLSRDL
jgi:hypothetical protein